ncbi:hypothetical protein [Streptomyces sp. NPDC090445]|uniref:hypothetical protein n=1 Tax=Streptomyces sp. NPDC090445 TaxID=3365963 RepID=UPI00380C3290
MTGQPLHVPLAELRASFDVLLRHLERTAAHDNAVLVEHDYFWSVPSDRLFDVAEEPDELTIGQLSESWQHVRNLLADPDHALGHHLVWLADVLSAIGREHPV